MKTLQLSITKVLFTALIGCTAITASAQTTPKQRLKVGVLHLDSNVPEFKSEQMGSLVRLELQKLDTFSVLDRYEMATLLQKANLKAEGCYGRLCVVQTGKALATDKMITGSIEQLGNQVVYTLQYVDVATESIERTKVMEFVHETSEIQTMTTIMLRELFNRQVDDVVLKQLQKPGAYETRARNPVTERLRLDGPRMGATMFTGKTARILQQPKSQGGYNVVPVMFQFGYQFEKQYLSSGDFQALFEFIPMVTGLDQGLFIPSMTFMNGIRSNKRGWEFAFGPTFNVISKTNGFYDGNGNWITEGAWNADPMNINQPRPSFIDRMDSRGDLSLQSSFVFAVGKTFRSGTMNIPVNAFAVPSRDGWRYGISIGYNARNRAAKK
jgi:hypothetical protein